MGKISSCTVEAGFPILLSLGRSLPTHTVLVLQEIFTPSGNGHFPLPGFKRSQIHYQIPRNYEIAVVVSKANVAVSCILEESEVDNVLGIVKEAHVVNMGTQSRKGRYLEAFLSHYLPDRPVVSYAEHHKIKIVVVRDQTAISHQAQQGPIGDETGSI